MSQTSNARPPRFLRLSTVMERTGLSRSTIYERIDQGGFPRQMALGPRSVGWLESDISAWIEERVSESKSKR